MMLAQRQELGWAGPVAVVMLSVSGMLICRG